MGYKTTSIIVTGFCTAAVYYLIKKRSRDSKARQQGCYPPRAYPHKDPFLGVDLFFQTASAIQSHRYLSELTRRYTALDNTFSAKSWGSSTINSIEPENIKAVFSSNFNDWGVEPVRLPAQSPFCGRGFITTDGAAWEHSRALLRPSFNKRTAIDLPVLETYLRRVIDRIPRDGSTFDLQPMLFSLVCFAFCHSRLKDRRLTLGAVPRYGDPFPPWRIHRFSFGRHLTRSPSFSQGLRSCYARIRHTNCAWAF